MGGGRVDEREFGFRGDQLLESVYGEVIDVLRKNVAVFPSQETHGERLEVRDKNETKTAGFQNGGGLGKKFSRFSQVFDDRPKSDGGEAAILEVGSKERFAQNSGALLLGVVKRGTRDVDAGGLILIRK